VAPIAPAAASIRSRERELIATWAPSCTSARAMPRPMPLEAPVTSAALPSMPRSTWTQASAPGPRYVASMRLTRAITVVAAGAATAWFLDRRRLLPGRRRQELPRPPQQASRPPAPAPGPPEPAAVEPEPALADPVFSPSEQPTREQPAVERGQEPVDVTSLVDDLGAPGSAGREAAIVDAEVVDDDDEQLAKSVRDLIAILPDVPSRGVSVEVMGGTVLLHGEIDRAGTIRELEERVRKLDGVAGVRNLLHLPGTPPPS